MNTNPAEIIKSLKESVAAIGDASGGPVALTDHLDKIAKVATDGALSLRKAEAKKNAHTYDETGFTPLVKDLWCDGIYCDILHRQHPDGSRNYIVKAPLDDTGNAAIGAFDYAPDVTALSKILMAAGLRSQPMALGYEWAINYNGTNDYPGNFNCEELRNCAVDALIIEEDPGAANDDLIVLFEIHPDGVQCNESYPNAVEWAEKRQLPHSTAEASTAPQDRS